MSSELSVSATSSDMERALDRLSRAAEEQPEPIQRAAAYNRLAEIEFKSGYLRRSLRSLEKAIENDPNDRQTRLNLISLTLTFKDYELSLYHLQTYLRQFPDHPPNWAQALFLLQKIPVWNGYEAIRAEVLSRLESQPLYAEPFLTLLIGCSADAQRASATAASARHAHAPSFSFAKRGQGRPITIGYVCGDFRLHATSILLVRTIELHDRARFRVIGFNLSELDDSDLGQRIRAAFDDFVDLRGRSDRAAAELIHSMGVDVLVDVHVHTNPARPGIFALKPAPIQVNYLGFPGTSGAPWIDYAIVDPIVLPHRESRAFSECAVRVGCYQPNDDRRSIIADEKTRAEHGLPNEAFVYGSFNGHQKISPDLFDLWAGILKRVPNSILWVLDPNLKQGQETMRNRLEQQGVAAERLIFASRLSHNAHLGRLAHADLLLDTLPYNGHTTTSDALWAGVPVLTLYGESFVSRVAASLLSAAGLPDLITMSQHDYAEMAVALAQDRDQLATMRRHLVENRRNVRLFDSATHTRELDAAFAEMVRRHEAGQRPAPFDVAGG